VRRWLVRFSVLALTFGSGFVALARSAWACEYEVIDGVCHAVDWTWPADADYPQRAWYNGGCPGRIETNVYGGSYGFGDSYGYGGSYDYWGGGSGNPSSSGPPCQLYAATQLGYSDVAGSMVEICSNGSTPTVSGPPQSSSSPPPTTPPPPNVGKLVQTVRKSVVAKLSPPTIILSPEAQGFVDFPELLGVQPVQPVTSSTTQQGVTVSVKLTPSSVNFSVAGDEYLGLTDQASFSCSYADAIAVSQMTQSQVDQLRQQESGMTFANAQVPGAQNSGCSPVPWYAFANMTGGPGEQAAPGNPSSSTAQFTASVVYQETWTVTGASKPSNLPSTTTGPTATASLPVGSAESPLCYGASACTS